MQIQALPGFRDFYPDEFALRAHIFRAWREVATRYGFEEYDGPPLEPLELYTAKSGDEIVGQLYNFIDMGKRHVALRPEMTPTLARMVAARANGLKKPIRWFSIPQLFRYERQQKGRLKEHFQLNCDLIGEPGPLGDAEIIALAIDVMRALGLTAADVKVRISDRRLLNAILDEKNIHLDHVPWAYQVLDKVGRSEYAGRKQAMVNAMIADGIGQLEAQDLVDEVITLRQVESWDQIERYFPKSASQYPELKKTTDALTAMGQGEFAELDLTIVRGLAYYTGIVFELFDTKGELRAICGGGRYDNLVGALGGVDLPCVGFGMGDVVLGELLKDKGLVPSHRSTIDVFIAGIESGDVPHILQLAHELRDAGFRVEYALAAQALGKQLRLADTRNARVAIVAGADERARGEVMLKDLAAKTQKAVRREMLVDELKRLMIGG